MLSITKLREQLNFRFINNLRKFLFEEIEYSKFPKDKRELIFDYSYVSIVVLLSEDRRLTFQIDWDIDEKLFTMSILRNGLKLSAQPLRISKASVNLDFLKRQWNNLIDKAKKLVEITSDDEKLLDSIKDDKQIINFFILFSKLEEPSAAWSFELISVHQGLKLRLYKTKNGAKEVLEFGISWSKKGEYVISYKDKEKKIKFVNTKQLEDDLFNAIVELSGLKDDEEFVSWLGEQFTNIIKDLEKELERSYQITPGFDLPVYGKGTIVGEIKTRYQDYKLIITHTGLNITVILKWENVRDKKNSDLSITVEFKPPSLDWMRTFISETTPDEFKMTLLQAVGPMMKFFRHKSEWLYTIKSEDLIWEDDFIKNIADVVIDVFDEMFEDIYESVKESGIPMGAFKSWLIHVFGPVFTFVSELARNPRKYTNWVRFLHVEPQYPEFKFGKSLITAKLGRLSLAIDATRRQEISLYIYVDRILKFEYLYTIRSKQDLLTVLDKVASDIDRSAKQMPEFAERLNTLWGILYKDYSEKLKELLEKQSKVLKEEKGNQIRKVGKNIYVKSNIIDTSIPWRIRFEVIETIGEKPYELISKEYSFYEFLTYYDVVLRDFIGLADKLKDVEYYDELVSTIKKVFLQAYMDVKKHLADVIKPDIEVSAKTLHRFSYVYIKWEIVGILVELVFDWSKPHKVIISMRVDIKDDRRIEKSVDIDFDDAYDLSVKMPKALETILNEIIERTEVGKILVDRIYKYFEKNREFYDQYILGHAVEVVFERLTLMPFADEALDLRVSIDDKDMAEIKIDWENRLDVMRESVKMKEYGELAITTKEKAAGALVNVKFSYFVNIKFLEPPEGPKERIWKYHVKVDEEITLRKALTNNILQELMGKIVDNIVKDTKLSNLQQERLTLIVDNINQQIKGLYYKFDEYIKDVVEKQHRRYVREL